MPRFELKYEFTLSGLINIIVVVVGGTFLYATLVSAQAKDAQEISVLKPQVASLEDVSASFNTRLTVVESRAETSDLNYEKLSAVVVQMADKLQVVAEDARGANKGVEYIRDWVKDIKEAAKANSP